MKEKIKIAFVKFGGLSAGGTERFLHSIAALLPKDRFIVDFYYCDSAPYIGSDWVHPNTDPDRKKYLEANNVNLIKFDVEAKDVTKPHHPWVNTNFFDVFDASKYDIIQTARAGHPEYPFTEIDNTWIVDAITLPGMAHNKENIFKVVHISQFQADTWINAGGDASKVEIVPIFQELPERKKDLTLKKELGLSEDVFVYGFHQRVDDGIFYPAALIAYKEIENDENYFLIKGGSEKYAQQAAELGIKNFKQLPYSATFEDISKFLETLDVFCHNRSDGETFGAAIAEALYHRLPIVSHVAPAMGHVETIGDAGVVCQTLDEYRNEMTKLCKDITYYLEKVQKARARYHDKFTPEVNMKKIISIYKNAKKTRGPWTLTNEEFWDDMWKDD